MNPDPSLSIGIAALNVVPRELGGTGIYVWNLVNALARYATKHKYTILVHKAVQRDWLEVAWPDNVKIAGIAKVTHEKSVSVQARWAVKRLIGLSEAGQDIPEFAARQIDGLRLSLIHFPATLIWPLNVQTRSILTFFDMQHEYFPEFFTESELVRRSSLYYPSVEKATHLIVPSLFTRDTLVRKYQVTNEKISLLYVGLNPSFKKLNQDRIDAIRGKYGLPRNYIYYPANPWQHKNHARLMAAMRIYSERYGTPPVLVSTGRLTEETRDILSLAIAAGVEENVIDLGAVPDEDLPGLYNGASMMVFPSLFEGFGMPLIEAMACGCPITAADASAVPEITRGAALLFNPFSDQEIADCINRLSVEGALRQKLIESGYSQLERFQWPIIVSELEEIYRKAIRS
ncbi:MAG TPA: glycosyltransferase family 1 protein [Patescibacteria group bacterium]|nr:glycosyltransferase family 1 protein [Patescibacteria group bacterium]